MLHNPSLLKTVKSVLFVCPLFCKFCDTGDFAKITGHKYLKSRAVFSLLLSSANKNAKINGAKITSFMIALPATTESKQYLP